MTKLPAKAQPFFAVPPHHRSRTSDVILALEERCRQGEVTLGTMTSQLGDRSFGVLLIVMTAFNIIPFISILTGLLVTILGLQMTIGMMSIRLPRVILDWQLPPERVRAALLAIEPKIRAIEKYVRPRWHFTEAPVVDRINGLIIAILGVIITLPIPFTNIGPGLVIIVMGLGLLERDGLVQILALAFGLTSMILVYFLLS